MNRLDVLFIHPNASRKIYQDLSEDLSAIEPPIWAGLLAGHCRKEGLKVDILDCEAEQLGDMQATGRIHKKNPRIACFVVYGQQPSASTQNMEGATSLSAALRAHSPDIKILFVGGHVAALPEITMQLHPEIDFVCQNEGVYTISNLLKANLLSGWELNLIPGLGYRMGDVIFWNKPSSIVSRYDMSKEMPGIPWDLLPMDKYRTALWHSYTNNCDRSHFASLYTSLGCPYRCFFCMINIINRRDGKFSDESNIFRAWKTPEIMKEFKKLAKMGIKNVKIADEMFVLNPNHFLEVCKELIKKKYGFNIWCYARIDTIKKEYLEIMKEAGINWIGLGIESGVKKVREDVIKGKFEEVDIRGVVRSIEDSGINVAANYIFGLPEDTMESMQDTLTLALELNTPMANFYCAMAYPGSPLYGKALENGWELPGSYAGYSQHSYETHPLPTKHISAKEVLKFRDEAWITYHTNINFLDMIYRKFGDKALREIKKSTKIKLKRKLLNGET
jgi:radical SAM superfamily enzyme YgiQ (UPF0313 family)